MQRRALTLRYPDRGFTTGVLPTLGKGFHVKSDTSLGGLEGDGRAAKQGEKQVVVQGAGLRLSLEGDLVERRQWGAVCQLKQGETKQRFYQYSAWR